MGNWNITITGVGSHHNPANDQDANRMAQRFVRELEEAGHRVSHASFTHGGADDLRKAVYPRPTGDPDFGARNSP